ncbi:MAG: PilW family protein, partial [Acidobacteriota bacterium]|nr:PilW family protein [Acidobacteriota bacterium]
LDLLTRDLESAGFGQGWGATQCALTVSYANGSTAAFPAVSAMQATGASTVPLTAMPLGYPDSSSSIATDLVLISASSLLSSGAIGESSRVTQFGTTQAASGQGAARSTQLPLPLAAQADAALQVGNEVQVRVQMSAASVCYLVPVAQLSPTGKALYLYSKGTGMPSTGYAGYDSALAAQGLRAGITDTELLNATVTDLGASSSENILTAYYIGKVHQLPALWRVHVDEKTGAVLDAQPVAVGAVSLQTRFLVGSTFETWAQVENSSQQGQVQAVNFALVFRTLHPDFAYTAPTSIAVPGFSSFAVPAADTHYHYTVFTSEVDLRNLTWSGT